MNLNRFFNKFIIAILLNITLFMAMEEKSYAQLRKIAQLNLL